MAEIRICLTGEFRSGKTTIADYAENTYHMVPFAFADDLKKDFHREYPHVAMVPKPREGYQMYGQLKRFVYGQDYWINRCFDDISRIRKIARNYNHTGSEISFMPLITDARQPNEIEACREEGFTIIKIMCPKDVRIQRATEAGDIFDEKNLNHETETQIKNLYSDYTIINDGTIEELYKKFDDIMVDLLTNKN
jgi:dephospho-CoA kinase